MKEYISKEAIIDILNQYLSESSGAEHFAYNAIKMEVLIMSNDDALTVRFVECPKCGSEVYDEDRPLYCPYCGERLSGD
jgi:DNA-directed RNA polymerase subunit RPC12/RpoP